jgi:4-aminobutyrate aminotransferase
MTRLKDLADKHPVIGEVRGKGLLLGVELINADRTPNIEAAGQIMEETRRRGLLVGKGGLYGNVIRFAPPMSLTMEEADEGIDIVASSFAALE